MFVIILNRLEKVMLGQDFGHRLRELRLAQGLTKETFCDDKKVLSVRQLTRIESGKSQPKLETLDHLAKRLNISVSELLGEKTSVLQMPVMLLALLNRKLRQPILLKEQL